MKTVSKGVLKAKMLEYFRYVEQTGEELIVTNNNVPTLKVLPIKQKKKVEDVFSDLRGKVRINDSIMEPETGEWGV
ncbi:MAG: type II toxin-antitoxin system Phd/YefM family antitoxin [bacterium]